MVIELDFEIYKNGDYDKVYLRDGKSQGYHVIMGRVIALWS